MTQPLGAAPRPQNNVVLGKRYGRYELLLQLARGGMGTVAVGRIKGAHGFRRTVAVKTIHAHLAEDEKYARMFMREADLASRLHHPNVVPVVEFEEQGGELFLVMEYYPSVPLTTLMRRCADRGKRMPLRVAVELVADACAGLDAAHNLKDDEGNPLNIVHRDMTPSNLLIGEDGTAKVTDFGVARADVDKFGASTTGSLKGKFAYLSPEQIQMVPLDRRSDVFALGVVLYETLCLKRLFGGQSELEILKAIVSDPPPDVRDVRSDCPDELAAIVRRALERDRGARYQSAGELRAALLALVPSLPATDRASYVREMIADDLEQRARSIIEAEAQLDAGALRATATATTVEPVAEPSISVSAASGMRAVTGPVATADIGVSSAARPRRSALPWAIGAAGAALMGLAALVVVRFGGGSTARASSDSPVDSRPAVVVAPDASVASSAPPSPSLEPVQDASFATVTVDAGVRRTGGRVGPRRPPPSRRCAEPPCDL